MQLIKHTRIIADVRSVDRDSNSLIFVLSIELGSLPLRRHLQACYSCVFTLPYHLHIIDNIVHNFSVGVTTKNTPVNMVIVCFPSDLEY